MPCLDTIKQVFQVAQTGSQHRTMLFKALNKLSETSSTPDEFAQDFIQQLKFCLIIFKKEPAVERIIDFVANYATRKVENQKEKCNTSSLSENSDEEAEDDAPINTFLSALLNFLLQVQNSCDKAVRFRSCQLISKIFENMDEEATIDEELAENILTIMMERLCDKIPAVRCQAVYSLSRLQDPLDSQCPVLAAYVHLMTSDSSADVRRMVMLNICITEQTLPHIIERTRDIKDSVRKLAFHVLAEKVSIRVLSIAQRIQLLRDGLNDRVESVKKACYSRLISNWVRACQNKIIDFLGLLDVQNSAETVEAVLRQLLEGAEEDDILTHVKALKDSVETGCTGNTIPVEKLDCERSLYWKCLAEHCASLGSKGQAFMDALLPEISVFCEYIQRYFDNCFTTAEVVNEFHQVFIMQQLLTIAGLMDLSDEVGRKNLAKLIHEFMVHPQMPVSLMGVLHERFINVEPDVDIRINQLAEVIADIKEPILVLETPQVKELNRAREVKMAGIRVKLNQLREELEECVSAQEFEKAAEIKSKITEVEQDRSNLENEATSENNSQTRIEKDDPATLVKCLSIAAEMLQGINRSGLNPTLITLVDTLILPGVQNEDPLVRNAAVKCLGLCSLLSRDFARRHLVLFLQVVLLDVEQVQITALKSILDLLQTFGLEAFKVTSAEQAIVEAEQSLLQHNEDSSDDDDEDKDHDAFEDERGENENEGGHEEQRNDDDGNLIQDAQKSVSSVFSVLIKLLDRENSEIRNIAAEGLAKLLLSGRVHSPKLLSRLLLLWYNPTTEDDIHLRHCLGVFLPVFAFECRANQELVAETFLPTLRTLFSAPSSSPLARVDVSNVADLMVELTMDKNIKTIQTTTTQDQSNSEVGADSLHGSLALKIANEILSDPQGPGTRVLCKTLARLNFDTANKSNLKDLLVLCTTMLQKIEDNSSKKYLGKFQQSLTSLTAENVTEGTGSIEAEAPTDKDSDETLTDL